MQAAAIAQLARQLHAKRVVVLRHHGLRRIDSPDDGPGPEAGQIASSRLTWNPRAISYRALWQKVGNSTRISSSWPA